MEKLQSSHLTSIYGAILAGVDYILMGAGIPMKIPAVLDHFSRNEPATYPLHVAGSDADDGILMRFSPADFIEGTVPTLTRPVFLAIISSSALAITLAKKANGVVDGFVIEGPTAGKHNAPPRGQLHLNDAGEPIYGERDCVDLPKILALGRPIWLAGGYGSPDGVCAALKAGAAGIQVGKAFAFCDESGIRDDYKRAVIDKVLHRKVCVLTDPYASPTGFPFKVASLEGTISEEDVFRARPRICDLGLMREAYRETDGQIAYRCPAEPVSAYVAKDGAKEKAERRKCLCNALLSAIGQTQTRVSGFLKPGVITAGDDLAGIVQFIISGANTYSAADVLSRLLSGIDQKMRGRMISGWNCVQDCLA
jgi:nitronate monooxygenase